MPKTALVFLATGAEEIEATVTVDVLRRAGIEVTVAGIAGSDSVKCSRNVVITPDTGIAAIANETFDIVILPGGQPGTDNLIASTDVRQIVQKHEKEGKFVAAICAAPFALKQFGISPGKTVTSYPGYKAKVTENDFYKYSDEKVVVDGNLITSQGPATSFNFALKIIEKLLGEEESNKVATALLFK